MANVEKDELEAPGQHKETQIVVNARSKTVSQRELSFREVVGLAYDNPQFTELIIYTVTYKRGHGGKPEDSMIDGDTVHVKEGMIFNVDKTDRS